MSAATPPVQSGAAAPSPSQLPSDQSQRPTPPAPAGVSGDPASQQRPPWLPDEFASPEQMAEAWKFIKGADAQQKQGQPAQQQQQQQPPANQDANTDYAAKLVSDAGLDYAELSQQYTENGTLSDEAYAALESKGFHRSVVDNYLAGQVALQQQYTANVLSDAGTDSTSFAEAAKWAAANLSAAELDAYEAAVGSGDRARAALAVKGLISSYQAKHGKAPNLAEGANGTAQTSVYRSRAELTADMRDPRYETDAAFRNDVISKLARSNI